MKIPVVLIGILLVALSFVSHSQYLGNATSTPYLPPAPPSIFVVKLDPRAARGACLPPLTEQPEQVLARNLISIGSIDNAPIHPVVMASLARVVRTVEKIGLGTFKSHSGLKFIFETKWGYSWHTRGTKEVHISPGTQNLTNVTDKRFGGTNNVAVLAHELAHYISLRDNSRIQNDYTEYAREPCLPTLYSRTNRSEEFAEVFAAFVSNPELLLNRGPACERAVSFMVDLFGEKADYSVSCEARRKSLPEN